MCENPSYHLANELNEYDFEDGGPWYLDYKSRSKDNKRLIKKVYNDNNALYNDHTLKHSPIKN